MYKNRSTRTDLPLHWRPFILSSMVSKSLSDFWRAKQELADHLKGVTDQMAELLKINSSPLPKAVCFQSVHNLHLPDPESQRARLQSPILISNLEVVCGFRQVWEMLHKMHQGCAPRESQCVRSITSKWLSKELQCVPAWNLTKAIA